MTNKKELPSSAQVIVIGGGIIGCSIAYHLAKRSNIDLIYKDAVYKAHKNGVEIKTIQVKWNSDGECYFVKNDLPICLRESDGFI